MLLETQKPRNAAGVSKGLLIIGSPQVEKDTLAHSSYARSILKCSTDAMGFE